MSSYYSIRYLFFASNLSFSPTTFITLHWEQHERCRMNTNETILISSLDRVWGSEQSRVFLREYLEGHTEQKRESMMWYNNLFFYIRRRNASCWYDDDMIWYNMNDTTIFGSVNLSLPEWIFNPLYLIEGTPFQHRWLHRIFFVRLRVIHMFVPVDYMPPISREDNIEWVTRVVYLFM